jgi:NADPH:quinone reductase-like Zn-dependent oxidoreductase
LHSSTRVVCGAEGAIAQSVSANLRGCSLHRCIAMWVNMDPLIASTEIQPMFGRRIRWPEPRKAELETFEVSSPGADQIVVRTHFSVLSRGTERDYLTAAPNTARQFPLVPGYSSAGLVTAVGDGVTSLQPGDPVICYHGGHTSHAVIDANHAFSLTGNPVGLREAALIVLASMSLQAVRKTRLELGERVVVWVRAYSAYSRRNSPCAREQAS